jgi:hypothetical protein
MVVVVRDVAHQESQVLQAPPVALAQARWEPEPS